MYRPSVELFNDFCLELIQDHSLDQSVVYDYVSKIVPKFDTLENPKKQKIDPLYHIEYFGKMNNNSDNDYDTLTNTNSLNLKRILKDVQTDAQQPNRVIVSGATKQSDGKYRCLST